LLLILDNEGAACNDGSLYCEGSSTVCNATGGTVTCSCRANYVDYVPANERSCQSKPKAIWSFYATPLFYTLQFKEINEYFIDL